MDRGKVAVELSLRYMSRKETGGHIETNDTSGAKCGGGKTVNDCFDATGRDLCLQHHFQRWSLVGLVSIFDAARNTIVIVELPTGGSSGDSEFDRLAQKEES